MAYHWLKEQDQLGFYDDYLYSRITRDQLYSRIPVEVINSVINQEIEEDTLELIFKQIDSFCNGTKPDVIIGGPPCQAYSLVGRARDENGMKGDKRNYLYRYYSEFLKKYKPEMFVFENVTGLISAKSETGESYLESMLSLFNAVGYDTSYRVLSAEKYGVIQNRRRVILVGQLKGKSFTFPEPDERKQEITVSEAFCDLPEINAGGGTVKPVRKNEKNCNYLFDAGILSGGNDITWHWARPHNERDLEIYRITVKKWNNYKQRLDYNDLPERLKTHRNRSAFTDRFKVVAGDLPYSHTVVAHLSKDGHYYIHPDINQNRSITPREAARLQSFPDDYYFESTTGKPSRSDAFRQIGNAVPVLLASGIAQKLKEQLVR